MNYEAPRQQTNHYGAIAIIYVQESAIHGRGLFATEFIAEGTVIGAIEGVDTETDGPYVLWIDGVRGFEVINDFKYVNHSPNANAAYYDDLSFSALRDIQPHEEITHNYTGSTDMDDEPHVIQEDDWVSDPLAEAIMSESSDNLAIPADSTETVAAEEVDIAVSHPSDPERHALADEVISN